MTCSTWASTPTNYALGDVYQVGSTCYKAINTVNPNVAPGTNSYFWQTVDCACSQTQLTTSIRDTVYMAPSALQNLPDGFAAHFYGYAMLFLVLGVIVGSAVDLWKRAT